MTTTQAGQLLLRSQKGERVMISGWLIWFLFAQYVVIAAVSAWERNWPRCSYFIFAGGISLSVLWMGKR